mgnify:CR=1 FL=1
MLYIVVAQQLYLVAAQHNAADRAVASAHERERFRPSRVNAPAHELAFYLTHQHLAQIGFFPVGHAQIAGQRVCFRSRLN